MSPPPVTPSPHRFIVNKPAPPRRTGLQQEQTPQRPSTQRVNATPRPSASQFNATPRFTFSSTPRPTATQDPSAFTPASARFVTPARSVAKLEDVVDLPSSDASLDIHDSIETEVQEAYLDHESADDEDGYAIDTRSPKRRRLSSSLTPTEEDNKIVDDQDFLSSSLPVLSSPPAPRRQITSTAPRFLRSTPIPPTTPQPESHQPALLKPPRFRPPDPSSQSQANTEPLPEQFSPHRRGQKYVAGGLAAEVRDWLMNIESAVPASGGGQRRQADAWAVRLVIDEISGGGRIGMTLVRGRQIHDAGEDRRGVVDNLGVVKVALAGEGAGTGLQKGKKAEVGKAIGIKAPLWEIVIEGERWGVGVDWQVLS